MAVFPLFVDLEDKLCLVAGGGVTGSRKAEILLQFGAKIRVVAPEIGHAVKRLEGQDTVSVRIKPYSEQDMDDVFLAVAATSSAKVNERVYQDAVKKNIPVNVVDDPKQCTFLFPSVVQRGKLVVGISTSGAYPALSKKLRKTLEASLPEDWAILVELLAEFRKRVRTSPMNQAQKEQILKRTVDTFFERGIMTPEGLKAILDHMEQGC